MRLSPCAGALLALAFVSGVAYGEETEHRLQWKDKWPRFRGVEYGATVALGFAYVMFELRYPAPREPNITGTLPLDEDIQGALRLESADDRHTVGKVADATSIGLVALPVAEGLLVPIFTDRWNFDVAWQLTWMNAESLAVGGLVNRFGHRVVARERPNQARCREDPESDPLCNSSPFASFPGGHTAGAFMGAGLSCAHHLALPLYGGGVPDVLACAVPLVAAAGNGVLRMMGDRHWASDIAAGAGIGFAAGFWIPTGLHYAFGWGDDEPPPVTLQPLASDTDLGLLVGGGF